MAIAYVAGTTATQTTSSTKSLALNVPAGIANGNLMFAAGVVDSSSAVLATPTGWTQLWATTKGSCNAAAWYRVASSEPSSYTWTWSASGVGAYACGAWSGVNTGTVIEQYTSTGISYLSGSVTTPSATPTQADWMLAIYTDERGSSTGTTWSTPSGMSARAATNVTGVAVECSVALFDTNGAVTAGTAYTYSSNPTSGTASVVAAIAGIMPPFTGAMPQPVQARQAVTRAAYW